MSPEGQIRVFIAVPLDPALREAAAGLRRHLNATADALRWVPPGNLHLTLKFLGEIAERRLTNVADAVREVARRTGPFTITLTGAGAFPSVRRPQVVWVGVREGSAALVALARDLDAALHRMKFPRERRPFRPHLTVARGKHAGPLPDLSGPLSDLAALVVGTQAVDTLVVMESRLNPAGAIYRPIEEVGLGEVA
jgi:2'-5' RNA ligase